MSERRHLLKYAYLKIAFAYIGVIIGAGLSSGQDLLQYFLGFGKLGLIGVFLLGILNAVFGKIMVTLGSYYRAYNHEMVFSEITHPVLSKLLDVVLNIGSFCMGFVMLAGAGSNLNQQFGIAPWLGALICSVLIVIVAFFDFEKITGVLGIFTPIMIVMIMLITVYSFLTGSHDMEALDASARTVKPVMGNVWLSVINYYALCAMSGVSMAFILGGSLVRIDTAEKGGLIGGILIGIIIMAASVSLFLNIDYVRDSEMPMLKIVSDIHPAFSLLYAVTVFALIFNTAFSLFYSIARRFSGSSTKRMRIIMIFVVLIGYAFSFGGFSQLIGIMYPVLGYMGTLLLIVLVTAWCRERRNIVFEKFSRRKMIRILLKMLDPDRNVTRKEKEIFNNLSNVSPAETESLKKDLHEFAVHVFESADDLKTFSKKELTVDDDKLKHQYKLILSFFHLEDTRKFQSAEQ
ncbi:hypothetical protein BXO88_05860 [Oribacterium sp. C9]|nr:hypothetical protein BXO88_05860 [Oribacterium sp. C9]